MIWHESAPYRDRRDAGGGLALILAQEQIVGGVFFAIPRGGVPVAVEAATRLGFPLDVVVPRKLPIPGNTEAGFGAVTEDGVIVLNEPLVEELGLTQHQIEHQAEAVKAEIRRRLLLYRARLPAVSCRGKTAIVVDDGLASGYTMLAAMASLRKRGADRVVAAAPVASSHAWELVRAEADAVVAPIVSSHYPFAVASFYGHWHDLTDREVFTELERYGKAREGREET